MWLQLNGCTHYSVSAVDVSWYFSEDQYSSWKTKTIYLEVFHTKWKRPVSESVYILILKLCTFHCQILVSRSTDGKPLNLSEFCASPLPKEVCSLVVAIIQCALRESSYDYSVGRLFLLVFHQRKPPLPPHLRCIWQKKPMVPVFYSLFPVSFPTIFGFCSKCPRTTSAKVHHITLAFVDSAVSLWTAWHSGGQGSNPTSQNRRIWRNILVSETKSQTSMFSCP